MSAAECARVALEAAGAHKQKFCDPRGFGVLCIQVATSLDAVLTHLGPWMAGRGFTDILDLLGGRLLVAGWRQGGRAEVWPCPNPNDVSQRAEAMVRAAVLTIEEPRHD